MKSPLEQALDEKILELTSGRLRQLALLALKDEEIQYMQDYANTVSIKRLHYNDHGPVHMRKVVLNTLSMAGILNEAGIALSLEREETGNFEDSRVVLFLAGMLHDVGMSIGREDHEYAGAYMSVSLVERMLKTVYGPDMQKRVILRSLILECILGHMAARHADSLESGVLLVADGCDMEKGRARIPMLIKTASRAGDIHKYSAASIEKVTITKGTEKAINISVTMDTDVGFFQVEEVLMPKIEASSIKPYIELFATSRGGDPKRYL
ncbi:MAG: phosphohydrolase [Spirochaetales bacterium]|nr:MAG: phosphohydrolase [Spirochaetales bacterium]